jgi:hypothetical protein
MATAEYVAVLTKSIRYKCGRRNLLFGVLLWEFVKSRVGCCILILQECADLCYTLYLSHFPTNKGHKVLNQESVGIKDCAQLAAM